MWSHLLSTNLNHAVFSILISNTLITSLTLLLLTLLKHQRSITCQLSSDSILSKVAVDNMIPSTPASKILIGIPLDPNDSNELLSWAIGVLARPNDTIVAIHVLVGEESKKNGARMRKQSQVRQAKGHVISVLGEFARICQSKQINLEAKVGFSSSIAKGLVGEAKSISACYLLLLRRLRTIPSNKIRIQHDIVRYCLEHATTSCTVVSIGQSQKISASNSTCTKEGLGLNLKHKTSPRTVLDGVENVSEYDESTEDEDTSSLGYSSTTAESPPLPLHPLPKKRTQKSGFNYLLNISSIFSSPLRPRNGNTKLKQRQQQPLLSCFSYDEIAKATDNFHPENVIGRGGYSEVYKGELGDGRMIAVKMVANDNEDGKKEKEFLMELGVIGHVSHPNTANLVGCCVENGLYLILSFSQNGNLATALHGKTGEALPWPLRYKIAIGVARGLHYLHKCCKHRIIHRDIKASNVLLGPDYEPQIADFGLAKWLPNKWSHHAVIPIEGTFGYLAPEYFMHGIVDEKTDVFAFGVLLLEIITGRRPVDPSKQNLILWAKPLMECGKINELADPKLEGKYDADQMHRVVLTASYCIRQSSTWRPSMSEVLELLSRGQDSEAARSWRIPKFTSDELDDYSMVFGYEIPFDNRNVLDLDELSIIN